VSELSCPLRVAALVREIQMHSIEDVTLTNPGALRIEFRTNPRGGAAAREPGVERSMGTVGAGSNRRREDQDGSSMRPWASLSFLPGRVSTHGAAVGAEPGRIGASLDPTRVIEQQEGDLMTEADAREQASRVATGAGFTERLAEKVGAAARASAVFGDAVER